MPPLSEEFLVHFATHCHINLGLKYSTIKLYICGIIYKFLEAGIISIFNSDCPSTSNEDKVSPLPLLLELQLGKSENQNEIKHRK
jgi:hypothetical protein